MSVWYLALAVLCVPLGLLAKQQPQGAPEWVANHFAGAVYVWWWCFLTHAVLPRAKPVAVALLVLLATCGIEFAQLWHPPFLEALRATRAGGLVLGSSFSWEDFPFYFLGAGTAWLVSSRIAKRADSAAVRTV